MRSIGSRLEEPVRKKPGRFALRQNQQKSAVAPFRSGVDYYEQKERRGRIRLPGFSSATAAAQDADATRRSARGVALHYVWSRVSAPLPKPVSARLSIRERSWYRPIRTGWG